MQQGIGVLLGALLIGVCQAVNLKGHYRGHESWVVAERFAFSKGVGTLEAEVLFPTRTPAKLNLYYLQGGNSGGNEFDYWKETYTGDYTCSQRNERANTVIDLVSSPYSKLGFETIDGVYMIRATVVIELSSIRTRWMFLAVDACRQNCSGHQFCDQGVSASWYFSFRNSAGWLSELGADEQGMFYACLVFLPLYALLFGYFILVHARLARRRKLHVTFGMLASAFLLSWVSVILATVYLGVTAKSGKVYELLQLASMLFQWGSEGTAILLLIVLGKGWTITTRKISGNGRMRICIYFTTYMGISLMAIIYYLFAIPKAAVVYLYDTPLGLVIAILRVLCCVWLCYAVSVTLRKYQCKRRFYTKLRIVVAVWILSLPFLAALNYGIVEYFRRRLLFALSLTFNYLLFFTLVLLYDPDGPFASSFPFHSTTTQFSMQQKDKSFASQAKKANIFVEKAIKSMYMHTGDMIDFLENSSPAMIELVDGDEDLGLFDSSQDRGNSPISTPKLQNWISSSLQKRK